MSIQNKIQKGGITPFLCLERVIILKRIKKIMISLIAWTVINVLFVTVYAAPFEMQNAIKPNIQMYSSSSNIVDTGKCGEDLIWTLYEDGLLSITGTGDMYDYTLNSKPWENYKNNITTLVLDEGITSIGDYAFFDCNKITGNLTIPDSVTSIGSCAFAYCSGFTGSLTIPDGVTSIGSGAFKACSGFTGSLTISDSVTSIEGSAFYDCSGFTGSLTISDGVTSIGDYVFANCSSFTGSLTIPDSVTSIGYRAFQRCSGLTGSLTIPNGVTSIGDDAFRNCKGFTGRLVIPQNVKTIGEEAFMHCINLQDNIIIPENVVFIGKNAFFNCKGITDVNIAKKKDSISGSPWGLITNNQAVIHWANPSDTAYKINIISPGDVEYNAAGKTTPDVVITDTER